uniref:Uncharacterized protein n=1 Tax=Arundo donax TaxID=35708 RepID=A0A0A8XQI9_ARUDO
MSVYDSHNAHLNSISFIVCPYLQQDATHAAYQELGHCNLGGKSVTNLQYHSRLNILRSRKRFNILLCRICLFLQINVPAARSYHYQ